MGLFGKKKKEEISPEELGFGFPATEKRKEIKIYIRLLCNSDIYTSLDIAAARVRWAGGVVCWKGVRSS